MMSLDRSEATARSITPETGPLTDSLRSSVTHDPADPQDAVQLDVWSPSSGPRYETWMEPSRPAATAREALPSALVEGSVSSTPSACA